MWNTTSKNRGIDAASSIPVAQGHDLLLSSHALSGMVLGVVRGGEGHMGVGKLLQTVTSRKAHMVVSVKPFGCMPSAGVSDGVQSLIVARYPEAIFTAIETTGDGEVNVQSRIQMDLFTARQKAEAEFRDVIAKSGFTEAEIRESPKEEEVHQRVALSQALGCRLCRESGTGIDTTPSARER